MHSTNTEAEKTPTGILEREREREKLMGLR
jgi:hypothetical protein